jgi:hypothetical protein
MVGFPLFLIICMSSFLLVFLSLPPLIRGLEEIGSVKMDYHKSGMRTLIFSSLNYTMRGMSNLFLDSWVDGE